MPKLSGKQAKLSVYPRNLCLVAVVIHHYHDEHLDNGFSLELHNKKFNDLLNRFFGTTVVEAYTTRLKIFGSAPSAILCHRFWSIAQSANFVRKQLHSKMSCDININFCYLTIDIQSPLRCLIYIT